MKRKTKYLRASFKNRIRESREIYVVARREAEHIMKRAKTKNTGTEGEGDI